MLQTAKMRETMDQIRSPKNKIIPYKDWATTVKEAKARPIPIGLPEHLKNYFENAMKKPEISNIFGGEHHQAHEQQRSRDRMTARKNVLCHVSRNRPHPTIFFPFQTGDRLNTYMVWIPEDRHPITSQSLPPVPFPVPDQRRNHDTSSSRRCQTSTTRHHTYGQFTGLNQTTYQDEIARAPFIHRTVKMMDHFPNVSLNNNGASMHRLRVR